VDDSGAATAFRRGDTTLHNFAVGYIDAQRRVADPEAMLAKLRTRYPSAAALRDAVLAVLEPRKAVKKGG
jgi:hypothetical protein